MSHWNIVKNFEDSLSKYTNSPHVICVDSCTNALFLVNWLQKNKTITLPTRTYISVAFSFYHTGSDIVLKDIPWEETGYYEIPGTNIIDSALHLEEGMYQKGKIHCLSFNYKKPLPIGRGGCILTDDSTLADKLRVLRCNGRNAVPYHLDDVKLPGFNFYMTPEQAARGLELMSVYKPKKVSIDYPDISKHSFFVGI